MPIYEFNGRRPVISPEAFVHPEAVIIGDVVIGAHCFIAPGAVVRADFGPVTIGDGTSIQDNVSIHVDPGARVEIAKNVIVAHNASLHDVTLHEWCIVGMGSVLLYGVVCEKGVVVAAGAVVPKGMRIPAGKLAAGNPARVIRDITPEMAVYVSEGVEEYKKLARLYGRTMKEIP